MPLLRKPLYQRSEGPDEDSWRLVFDTDANRLFVEHEKQRGDTRGQGYGIETDEVEIAEFLNGSSPGQAELVRLVASLFQESQAGARA